MKAYLGLRDSDAVYLPEREGGAGKLFGIDLDQRGYTRVRIA